MGATPRSGALAPESPLVPLSAGASDTSSAIGLPHAALGVWREGPSGSRVRSPPAVLVRMLAALRATTPCVMTYAVWA